MQIVNRQILNVLAALAGGVMAFVLFVSPVQGQELLSNPNLDATSISSQVLPTPTGWDVTASRTVSGSFNDGASSEPWAGPAPTPVTSGDHGLFFKPFTGNGTTGDKVTVKFSQAVPATAGSPYFLTGWVGAEANYIGLSDPTVQTQFLLEFYDAGNNLINSATLDLVAAGLGQPNGEPFNYRQFALSAVAPAGTASVRAGATMIDAYGNPAGGGQALVADDFSLTVPEPASLALFGASGLAVLARRRHAR